MNYFKLEEFFKTDEKINNAPREWMIIRNIEMLNAALNELRERYGEPIVINSGYRCEEVNKAVGGVKDSHHLRGLAADVRPLYHPSYNYRWRLQDLNRCIAEMSGIFKEVVYHSTYTHVALVE